MKTLNTKQIAVIATAALLAGWSCKAEELKLSGKSITVYPIVFGEPGEPVTKQAKHFGIQQAEVTAADLEQNGMKAGVSSVYPDPISGDESVAEIGKKLLAFHQAEGIDSDYALFARIEGVGTDKGPVFTRICIVLVESGKGIAWSEDLPEFPKNIGCPCPMHALQHIQEQLLVASDLEEPEPHFRLHGKTILVCPILSGKPSDDDDAWQGAIMGAMSLGVKLERRGMLPVLSPQYPESIMEEESLVEVVKQLQALRKQWKTETDYILFARFEGKRAGKKFVVRARAVMADATGRMVWSQDPAEFFEGGNIWPIVLIEELEQTLTSISDLKEPDWEAEPGPFETRARKWSEDLIRERKQRQNTEERS